jgi:hypothetical protein
MKKWLRRDRGCVGTQLSASLSIVLGAIRVANTTFSQLRKLELTLVSA